MSIRELWEQGRDTLDIARALDMPEAVVANVLPDLRDTWQREGDLNAPIQR